MPKKTEEQKDLKNKENLAKSLKLANIQIQKVGMSESGEAFINSFEIQSLIKQISIYIKK